MHHRKKQGGTLKQLALFALLVFGLTGCLAHSYGPSKVTTQPGSQARIPANSVLYLAYVDTAKKEFSAPPVFIQGQFTKFLMPVAKEVITGDIVPSIAAALKAAQKEKSDYVVALEVEQWKNGSLLSPSQEAIVNITILDQNAQGAVVNQTRIEATCYVMVYGLELSARECARPKIEAWVTETFGQNAAIQPFTDPSNRLK